MGCTHYPLAFNAIRRILPSSVAIVDPAQEAAHELRRKLFEADLVRHEGGIPNYEFNLSAPRDNFQSFVENYLAVDNVITKVVNLWQTEHSTEPHALHTENSLK
jgi:glutamate racemase